jgi:hypothetical protein
MMLSFVITIALLGTPTFAVNQEKRQTTDEVEFTSKADQLITLYIPKVYSQS